ncbi:hypothetical protein B0H14DRAFT_2649899 [Mycena olivaceomarginata]|nr:hypothetical protein B0H14DRAFT_2649899 [Mycena olivaceomarginata]
MRVWWHFELGEVVGTYGAYVSTRRSGGHGGGHLGGPTPRSRSLSSQTTVAQVQRYPHSSKREEAHGGDAMGSDHKRCLIPDGGPVTAPDKFTPLQRGYPLARCTLCTPASTAGMCNLCFPAEIYELSSTMTPNQEVDWHSGRYLLQLAQVVPVRLTSKTLGIRRLRKIEVASTLPRGSRLFGRGHGEIFIEDFRKLQLNFSQVQSVGTVKLKLYRNTYSLTTFRDIPRAQGLCLQDLVRRAGINPECRRAFWSDMEHIHLGGSSPASQYSTSPAKYGEGGGFVQGNLDKYGSSRGKHMASFKLICGVLYDISARMSTPNLEGRPNPGVLGHRCWLVCKSEEHPTKGGLSNAIDGSGSFDVVKDSGHRLMVLMVLALSTTASTDVEQLKMGPKNEHSTSAMDVELVLASLTTVDTIGGTSGLDIVDNSEHSICHYVQGTEGLGIVNNMKIVLAPLTAVSSVIAWADSGLDAVDHIEHSIFTNSEHSHSLRQGTDGLGIVGNSEQRC